MKVKTIKVKEGQALTEWMDDKNNIHRAWVPAKDIKDEEVADPERGLEYGDDLSTLLGKLPSKADVVQALHNQGLWSFTDLPVNPTKVNLALASVYVNVANSLLVPLKGE